MTIKSILYKFYKHIFLLKLDLFFTTQKHKLKVLTFLISTLYKQPIIK